RELLVPVAKRPWAVHDARSFRLGTLEEKCRVVVLLVEGWVLAHEDDVEGADGALLVRRCAVPRGIVGRDLEPAHRRAHRSLAHEHLARLEGMDLVAAAGSLAH